MKKATTNNERTNWISQQMQYMKSPRHQASWQAPHIYKWKLQSVQKNQAIFLEGDVLFAFYLIFSSKNIATCSLFPLYLILTVTIHRTQFFTFPFFSCFVKLKQTCVKTQNIVTPTKHFFRTTSSRPMGIYVQIIYYVLPTFHYDKTI